MSDKLKRLFDEYEIAKQRCRKEEAYLVKRREALFAAEEVLERLEDQQLDALKQLLDCDEFAPPLMPIDRYFDPVDRDHPVAKSGWYWFRLHGQKRITDAYVFAENETAKVLIPPGSYRRMQPGDDADIYDWRKAAILFSECRGPFKQDCAKARVLHPYTDGTLAPKSGAQVAWKEALQEAEESTGEIEK
jgi:hypothetical protein